MEYTEIIFGKGLKDLWFGLSRDQVEKILGKPELVENDIYGKEDEVEQVWWQYESMYLQLGFGREDNFRLGHITIRSINYTLNGVRFIGEKRNTVLDIMSSMNFEIATVNEPDDSDTSSSLSGVAVIHYNDANVSLWFKYDILSVVQLMPFYKDDGNTVVWPEEAENV